MKTRIEKVYTYRGEDIMLIAPAKEMNDFAIYMINMIHEAERKAYEDGRISTAKNYDKIADQFRMISYNIINEEE